MHDQEKHRLLFLQTEQMRAKQRPVRKIERPLGFARQAAHQFGLFKVNHRQFHVGNWGYHLDRLAVALDECRAQTFVPLRDGSQRFGKRRLVKGPTQAPREREVVRHGGRVGLLDEPQSLLCVRQRQRLRP